MSEDLKCSNLEVYLLCIKLDQNGEKVVRDGMWVAEILKLKPVRADDTPVADEYEEWEGQVIAAYLHRHNL